MSLLDKILISKEIFEIKKKLIGKTNSKVLTEIICNKSIIKINNE